MVTSLFSKSDNAGCYHGNFILEATFKLCKAKGLKLLRYDFNEPCKGKDQCDRESAGAKTKMNSFVNSGKDIKEAEHFFQALHHGNGIQNSKASIIEINSEESTLVGNKTPGITAYHSVQFFEDHMKLFRYWNIGPGKTVKYEDNCKFVSSFNRVQDFSQTYKSVEKKSMKQKKREDRELCMLLFCPEASCSEHFQTKEELDQHLLSEQHVITVRRSSMDVARASFISKMKVTLQLHTEPLNVGIDVSKTQLAEAIKTTPMLKRISEQGWALPKRQTFSYSEIQRNLLFSVFVEGEKTGKKKSPGETERFLRTQLTPSEYVTSAQIRSLFSRWSSQLKKGTLKLPEDREEDPNDHNVLDNEDGEEVSEAAEEDIDDYECTVYKNLLDIQSAIADWQMDDYVALQCNRKWYPGKIAGFSDNGMIAVDLMNYKLLDTENKFVWPLKNEQRNYDRNQLLLKLDTPEEMHSGKRYHYYKFSESDFSAACDMLRMALHSK